MERPELEVKLALRTKELEKLKEITGVMKNHIEQLDRKICSLSRIIQRAGLKLPDWALEYAADCPGRRTGDDQLTDETSIS